MCAWPCAAHRRALKLLFHGVSPFISHGGSASRSHSQTPHSAESRIPQRTHLNTPGRNTESQRTHLQIHVQSIYIDKTDVISDAHRHLSSLESLAEALSGVACPVRHADIVFLASLLRMCGEMCGLIQGQLIHIHIIKCDAHQILFWQNVLLQMYGKCRAIDDAYAVFARMRHRDPHSWSFMISACNHSCKWDMALELFNQLRIEGFVVDEYILSCIFSACAGKEDLRQGKHAHTVVVGSNYETVEAVANALLCLYGRCHCLLDLQTVFTKIEDKTAISWSTLIMFYTRHNEGREALFLWCRMQVEAVLPNKATTVGLIDACANLSALHRGKQAHSCLFLGHAFEREDAISTSLISMYGKCGDLGNALKVFRQLQGHSVISWTALMAGYAQHGLSKEAFEIFYKMQQNGIVPNEITYVCILEAYNGQKVLESAKQMHARIKHSGFDTNMVVGTALVKMYGKCGSPDDARATFEAMPHRSLISWNTVLAVYAQHHLGEEALKLFSLMLRRGETLNHVTFITMLSVAASEGALIEGKWMHDQVVRHGFCKDVVVCNALVNMYSKCGQVIPAQNVFDRLPERTVISWNSMIPAYAYHGHGKEILLILQRMRRDGVHPNLATFKVILHACSHAGLVEDASACLKVMSKVFGLLVDRELIDCVIDLLGRTGRLAEVEAKICLMPFQPRLVSWMTLLGAYSSTADVQRGEHVVNQVHELFPEFEVPYVILSNMYVTAGRSLDAERLLSSVKERDLIQQDEFSYIDGNGEIFGLSCIDNQSFGQDDEMYNEVCCL